MLYMELRSYTEARSKHKIFCRIPFNYHVSRTVSRLHSCLPHRLPWICPQPHALMVYCSQRPNRKRYKQMDNRQRDSNLITLDRIVSDDQTCACETWRTRVNNPKRLENVDNWCPHIMAKSIPSQISSYLELTWIQNDRQRFSGDVPSSRKSESFAEQETTTVIWSDWRCHLGDHLNWRQAQIAAVFSRSLKNATRATAAPYDEQILPQIAAHTRLPIKNNQGTYLSFRFRRSNK